MKQKNLAIILGSILIITILWVIFSVYHSRVTSTIKDPLTYQILPIEGTFDQNAINKIKERQKINPLFDAIVSPTPIPTPTEEIAEDESIETEEEIETETIEEITDDSDGEDSTEEDPLDPIPTEDPNETFEDE